MGPYILYLFMILPQGVEIHTVGGLHSLEVCERHLKKAMLPGTKVHDPFPKVWGFCEKNG